MDIAYITPTSYLDRISSRGQILLALAHLIDDKGENEYSRYHRREARQGKRIICDNGLFEGEQIDPQTLLHRASLIGAQIVCAPDSLYDSGETIKRFKQFIRLKQDEGLVFDVMGIPQADNPIDWWDCFRFMDLSKDCHYIGLSILSIPKCFNRFIGKEGITPARMYLIKQLYRYEILRGRRITPCHLLGLGESLADLTLASRLLPDTIVSNDSSSAFVHGVSGVKFTKLGIIPGGKIKERLDFSYDKTLTGIEEDVIWHNMCQIYNLANQSWDRKK